nr:unnamed protein product [Callosobruchus analis]
MRPSIWDLAKTLLPKSTETLRSR